MAESKLVSACWSIGMLMGGMAAAIVGLTTLDLPQHEIICALTCNRTSCVWPMSIRSFGSVPEVGRIKIISWPLRIRSAHIRKMAGR
jgi:hypothetical protein